MWVMFDLTSEGAGGGDDDSLITESPYWSYSFFGSDVFTSAKFVFSRRRTLLFLSWDEKSKNEVSTSPLINKCAPVPQ